MGLRVADGLERTSESRAGSCSWTANRPTTVSLGQLFLSPVLCPFWLLPQLLPVFSTCGSCGGWRGARTRLWVLLSSCPSSSAEMQDLG